MSMSPTLENLINEIHACQRCAWSLVDGVRPVIQVSRQAKILIAGQAPGRKVHLSGIPFDDASGDRLQQWMGVSKQTFYDQTQIAIVPMGFCYPGTGKNGDFPPRKECAPAWRAQLLAQMPNIELIIVIGQYAQAYHFNNRMSLTERVKHWQQYWPSMIPLPHPSPRNNRWLSKNPWFDRQLVPQLQQRVAQLLSV